MIVGCESVRLLRGDECWCSTERKIEEHCNSCRIQLRRCAVGMEGRVLQQIECGRAVHRTCDDVALLKQEVLDHHLRNEF